MNKTKIYNHNFKKFLIIRAGHTLDMLQPLPKNIFVLTNKRDRKLVLFGFNKQLVNKLAKEIHYYRKPSVYTGRGIRQKYKKSLRKEGKKDKQKGKSF